MKVDLVNALDVCQEGIPIKELLIQLLNILKYHINRFLSYLDDHLELIKELSLDLF